MNINTTTITKTSKNQLEFNYPKNKTKMGRLPVTRLIIWGLQKYGGVNLKKVDYKGRIIKRQLSKCKDVCRSYSEMQDDYARFLQIDDSVKEFTCNVKLEDDPETESYTSDFVITLADGTLRVRECVYRKHLERPSTARLLDTNPQ